MKTKLFAIILCALILVAALGCAAVGGLSPRERYKALLGEGVITEAEFAKLEQYDFELPESEKEPIEDFVVGEITTGVILI